MNILLTGADGFTGRHFTATAEAAGHQVFPLQVDLTDQAALAAAMAPLPAAHAVVHLAAISFVGHGDVNAFYAVNVIGTMNLLAELSKIPVSLGKVLLASSANVYGNCDASPIAETQAPAPVNHYAMSKLAMEFMARTWADRLPIVISRPFNYTGPGQAANFVIPKLVNHFAQKAPAVQLGNLQVEREFNDVQMVCSAYLHLLQHGQAGEAYNVCSGKPHTLQYVIERLTQLSGHSLRVEVNPAFVRANELHSLCGSPAKLDALLAAHAAHLDQPDLDDTLQRMLIAARAGA